MAYLSQQGAVSHRKIRPRYTDMINARTPDIYSMMALEDAKKAQVQNQANIDRQFTFNEEAAHDARKDANRATNLGYGNMAANLYFQSKANTGVNDMLGAAPSDIGNVGDVASPEMSEFSSGGTSAGSSAGSKVWESGSDAFKNFGGTLMNPNTLMGGAIGGAASNMYGGKNEWSKAAIGAGAGAASQWLLGGGLKSLFTGAGAATDWYSTALAGGLGGALSFF